MSPETRGEPTVAPRLTDGLRSLEDLELSKKRVLVRLDLNVPTDAEGRPLRDDSLETGLATLRRLMSAGAYVVALAHLGNPRGQRVESLSLENIGARLSELGGWDVFLPDDCLSDAAKKVILDLRDGQICLLENLRFQPGEQANDDSFARRLASYGDIYVNDALRASLHHHASVCTLPELARESAMGVTLKQELDALTELLRQPENQLSAIIGGPGLSDQIDLIESLMPRSKVICVGAGVGTTLLAAQGMDLGATHVETTLLARGRTLLEKATELGVEILLPIDLTWASDDGAEPQVLGTGAAPSQGTVRDVGPATLELFEGAVSRTRATLVTGALHRTGRERHVPPRPDSSTARLVERLTRRSCYTFIAGDDTIELVRASNVELAPGSGFASKGGAATLRLLLGKSLPGIEALRSAGKGEALRRAGKGPA